MAFNSSLGTRTNLLLAVTSLVVAYVRTFLQYHQYAWRSISEFLISWFVHYVAVILLVGISYVTIKAHAKRFLADVEDSQRGMTMDEAFVYVPLVLLVCAVAIFVLAHWPATSMLDD